MRLLLCGLARFTASTLKVKQGKLIQFPLNYVGNDLSSRLVSKQVFSALQSLTSVFGMGTGGPSAIETLTVGAPSGIRTRDPLIKSQLLYQLS